MFNNKTIEVALYEAPIIPRILGWVTDFSNPSSDGTFKVNYFESHDNSSFANHTLNEARSLHKRTLPPGQRKGKRDVYHGQPGVWYSEDYFNEDRTRRGERKPVSVKVYDANKQLGQVAQRAADTPEQLDPLQFPGLAKRPVPMRRISDPSTGRREGGNHRRPNNEWFHKNLGIKYPPGVSESQGKDGREWQDEDSREASRTRFHPGDPLPKRYHSLVHRSEQAHQSKLAKNAPKDRPIYQAVDNMPERYVVAFGCTAMR